MNESSLTFTPRSLTITPREEVQQLLSAIQTLQLSAMRIKKELQTVNTVIVSVRPTIWESILFLLKNKFGLTKDAAKKMFYDYKSKGEPEEEGEEPKKPETIDEKMNAIMGYMKDTSAKLESIEKDITYLKQQVEAILKKL